ARPGGVHVVVVDLDVVDQPEHDQSQVELRVLDLAERLLHVTFRHHLRLLPRTRPTPRGGHARFHSLVAADASLDTPRPILPPTLSIFPPPAPPPRHDGHRSRESPPVKSRSGGPGRPPNVGLCRPR